MRIHLISKRSLILVCAMLVGFATVPTPATGTRDESSNTIAGSGCVSAGVEAGCLMVTDSKTGTVYNVYFRGKKPSVGTAIRFTGTPHDGPTTCMQGRAVNVRTWSTLKMKCQTETTENGGC